MECISPYIWEFIEVNKKSQNEPLTNDEKEDIIHVYNQVVKLCRTADTSGIEIFDMQGMKLKHMNCERILCEFAKHVANNTKPGLFEEVTFSRLLTLLEPPGFEKLLYLMYFRGMYLLCAELDYIAIGIQLSNATRRNCSNNCESSVILCSNTILIYFLCYKNRSTSELQ